MKTTKPFILIFIVLQFLILCSCMENSNFDDKNKIQSTNNQGEYTKIEDDLLIQNENTENYMFYWKNHEKVIALHFNSDISILKINRAELFNDNDFITDNIIINSITDNDLNITINEYIDHFNTIRIYDNNNKHLDLFSGDYYFQQLSTSENGNDIINTSPQFTTTQSNTMVSTEFTPSAYNDNVNCFFIIPDLSKKYFTEDTLVSATGNSTEVTYNLNMDSDADSISSLYVEEALIEKHHDGTSYLLGIQGIDCK